jgi:hypothetical protein
MMNSDRTKAIKNVVNAILELLTEERISSEIDEPMEQAAQSFRFKVEGGISHSVFNRAIAEFVRHIYEKGIRLRRHLSEEEALGEAIFLLEHSSNQGLPMDYEANLVNITNSKLESLELVLLELGEAVKAAERQKYIAWVFAYHVDQLDWKTRCFVVKTYLEEHKAILPPQLLDLDPAQLASHWRDLIINHLSTDRLFRQVLGSDGSARLG